jgi:serine/threonine protein kinase/tetratricopeptide (TPR) repeat protein
MTNPNEATWSHDASIGSTALMSDARDSEVAAALEEYCSLQRAGSEPDRAAFLRRHSAIAASLVECLDGLEFVNHAAPGLSASLNGVRVESRSDLATLGDYRLIREIGRGGMGVVYEAEQLSLGRRVALKVLPSAAALDSRQLQRFQVEAQAAALLHHDHIVPVYGIGVDQGTHYYAMQLIDGQSLTEVIKQLRSDAPTAGQRKPAAKVDPIASGQVNVSSSPRSIGNSSWTREHCRETARLGLQAALALEHAHQLGVIHRDVKPSNLLLDGSGKLWVADFGLARLPQENHDLTQTGDLIGTLRYMSPEQVRAQRGEVQSATDTYSLGVTLYELLTLRAAFDHHDRQELLRQILQDEPIPPRKLNPAIARDLETIVLKAMEKEPSARYVSAGDLADDLRRFLDDQPVRARRPGLVDRAVKFARRHRRALLTSAIALFLTLAATTVVLWQAKRRTDASLAEMEEAYRGQRLALEYSLGALDQITYPRVFRGGAAPKLPLDDETGRMLQVALSYYVRIPQLFGEDTRFFSKDRMLKEGVAKAYRHAGFCRLALGQPLGQEDYRQSIALYERLAAQRPGFIWLRTGLIETLIEQGSLLRSSDETAARDAFRRATTVADTLVGDPAAASPCYTGALIGPFNDLALRLTLRPPSQPGDAALAVRLASQAVEWNAARGDSWTSLGLAHYRSGELPEANSALKKAIEFDGAGNPLNLLCLAAVQFRHGQVKEAHLRFDNASHLIAHAPGMSRNDDIRAFQQEVAQILSK